MSTQYLDHRIIGLQEYIERQSHQRSDGAPPYAHPVDAWILKTLESTPAKAAVEKAVDTLVSIQLGQFLATSLPVDRKSFPDLYDIVMHCAETLDIPTPHTVTFDSPFLFNAFTAGTDDYSFVAVTAGLTGLYKPEEATFVIGHECGHIAARHMVYHTLAWILSDAALMRLWGSALPLYLVVYGLRLPLYAWSRRSEVTADRAGLLCCGDIKVAERALVRLVTGMADIDKVDIDDYLERYKENRDLHSVGTFGEVFMSHPIIPKRVTALRLFARSEPYYHLTGKTPPPGEEVLSQEELDRRVQQIVQP